MQLAEAMACGTTCISTGQGALREVAGTFAIDVEMDSVESVVSAILYMDTTTEATSEIIGIRSNTRAASIGKASEAW